MSNCNSDCGSCSQSCASRREPMAKDPLNELSSVKKVIAVMSGKGGVGKSLVTSMLAVLSQREGHKTAVMDSDITGPSIPQAFGVHEKLTGNELGFFPAQSAKGTDIVSLNLLLPNETDPVIWRGSLLSGTVKQFWSEAIWKDEDIMFIDMPPGTGDVPLTVFQSLPIDGIVIVTSPQELVSMIVEKSVKMANMMHIPVLAVVENMSYFECPDCGKRHYIYGESRLEEIAAAHNIDCAVRIPIDRKFAAACDSGLIELVNDDSLLPVVHKIFA
ncbi:MAG: Mrp/NBP35 family ATP-binding protein [Clostridia bacterium]|nr:Mrp/NBP35 family ATP-binding protein [Clostridia bacterium]